MAAPANDPNELRARAMARWAALEKQSEHDLGTFIELHNPKYDRPDHLADILEALDRSMREPVFALVEAPPQHGKTETFLAGLARRLRYRPEDQIAYCSYAASFALRKSRRARDLAARAGVFATRTQLRKQAFDPSATMSYWQTREGGSFTAGGRNGQFTGDGYDTVLGDDLLKGREEAENPIFQEKAIQVVRSTFGNRIRPGGSFFVTHQPWNDKDPIAQLKSEKAGPDGQTWELISLPAIRNAVYDKEGNLIGGEPLWPARYSLRWYAKTKHIVGDYNWHSQYTLERRPKGKHLFGEPARFIVPEVDGAVIMISVDPGIEDDEMKDSSGIVVASCYRRASRFYQPDEPLYDLHMDILSAEDRWFDWPDLLDYLEELQTKTYRGANILLEEVSAFKALSAVAKRLNRKLRLYPITPRGSKWMRAQPASKAWARGHIRLPLPAALGGGKYDGPWVKSYIDEANRFTGRPGGKDNRIDAMTQLFDYAEVALASLEDMSTDGDTLEMANSPFA
jgi:phage terminase large subunit-like protein